MPERPAAFDTTLPPTVRRLLLLAASVTLAFLCWFLLDEDGALTAQDLRPSGSEAPRLEMRQAGLERPPVAGPPARPR